jgi:protoporphyrinogen/coproporphyrinogen III oxidase
VSLSETEVAIIGGGITGLTAAYELTRHGRFVTVLEASPRAGGLIRTEHSGGFTVEAGPDSLLATKPAGLELVRALGLGSEVIHVRTPGAFVLRGHRLYRLPSPSLLGLPLRRRALMGYDLLPRRARLRLAREPRVPQRMLADDESVASFFRRRFGADTVDLIAQPLLGGIHAGNIEDLSMASLFPRLVELEREHGSVLGRGGLRGVSQRPLESAKGGSSPFVSLRGGMETLVSALLRALPEGAIHLDAPVERVERSTGGWRLSGKGASHLCSARAVVFAAPASLVGRLIAPLDAAAADLCARVPYVSTASVALAWPRHAVAHPLNGTGFVVARRHSDVRITAATWVSSKWEARAPEGAVLLRAFIGGAHDPGAVDLSDDELLGVVRRDLAAVMGVTAEPTLARVFRWRNAGAQHTVGHLQRVEAIETRLRALGGLHVAGSGFRSVGIPDCVADARRVAAAIAETR